VARCTHPPSIHAPSSRLVREIQVPPRTGGSSQACRSARQLARKATQRTSSACPPRRRRRKTRPLVAVRRHGKVTAGSTERQPFSQNRAEERQQRACQRIYTSETSFVALIFHLYDEAPVSLYHARCMRREVQR